MTAIYLLAGSYAGQEDEGIQVLRFDMITRTLEKVSGIGGVENPSFVIADARGRRAFAVSETKTGGVVALSVEGDVPTLREVCRLSTEGWAPCHLSLDEQRGWLHVVNYMSGEVTRFRVAETDGGGAGASDGGADQDWAGLSHLVDVVRHEGSGMRRDRQESAHPHSVWNLPAGGEGAGHGRILVVDLGMDALVCYDSEGETLTKVGETKSAPGRGPRHVAFHPSEQSMYVVNELSSSISVYELEPDGLGTCVQEISTLPVGIVGAGITPAAAVANTAADIHLHPSGAYLYASNRGHDSIVTYAVAKDGTLTLMGHTSAGGRMPRNFAVLPTGDAMLVANQDSDAIVVMDINGSGEPVPTGNVYRMSRPCCLQVLPR